MTDELAPPRKSVELEDPGVHTMTDSSDESSDRFTDASEGHKRTLSRDFDRFPVPITRVERLDDEPAYGEVPGTAAYKLRTQDAVPDEVEVVTRSRSTSRVVPLDRSLALDIPVPRIVAEKIDPDKPSYGDVPGTAAYEKRRADAVPDMVIKSPVDGGSPGASPFSGSPTASIYRSTGEVSHPESEHDSVDGKEAASEDGDGFGDDFDEFEEGQEADDFGEFDDGFQQQEDGGESFSTEDSPRLPAVSTTSFPSVAVLDWSEIDSLQDLQTALEPYTSTLFPTASPDSQSPSPNTPSPSFLSDRSLSLYSQLVAPPPLAPPNWLRSRIRRLFLVSLGVPVDLDEILPASKQKKLVLPSLNLRPADRSPRHSSDSRPDGAGVAAARLMRGAANDSSGSLDSTAAAAGHGQRMASRRRRDEAQEPRFDMSEAVRAGRTTDVKLAGMSDGELASHVQRLRALELRADEVLEYWQRQREGAVKEKEAFEGVIENLVKHARKVRK